MSYRELSSVRCDDLEGWEWEGVREGGIYVYLQLIHAVVQQNLTQHCKAIILQLKKIHLKKVFSVFLQEFYDICSYI